MPREFRAVALSDLRSAKGDASLSAATVFDALRQAQQILGESTVFDLLEGGRLVLSYRPVRKWRSIPGRTARPG